MPFTLDDLLNLHPHEVVGLINQHKDALIWCSGSADFGPGGQAREGWLKVCEPLIK